LSAFNYQQALDYIYSFIDYEGTYKPQYNTANYDLRRVAVLLERLGNPHQAAKSVHVAGTKGKGSTSAMVASVLTTSGYVTGLYTSPHLHKVNERIRVDGQDIADEELVDLVELLKPDIEAVHQRATYGRLTTFELLTVLAFTYFGQKEADFQVLEVGMGGRLDATNVISPSVCIITAISFDHVAALGKTLSQIAAEKAGIIKPGSIVISSPQPAEAARIIEKTCLNYNVPMLRVGSDIRWQSKGFDMDKQWFTVDGISGSYELSIPLLGTHQLDNAAAAVAALELLSQQGYSISRESIAAGLGGVVWPGRLQVLRRQPLIVADGAHNPESARGLKQSLVKYFGLSAELTKEAVSNSVPKYPGGSVLIIGASSGKDIAGIVAELHSLFDSVIVTSSRHPRAMAPSLIESEFTRYGIEVVTADDVAVALSLALSMNRDFICIAGSLFLVGEAIERVNMPYTE